MGFASTTAITPVRLATANSSERAKPPSSFFVAYTSLSFRLPAWRGYQIFQNLLTWHLTLSRWCNGLNPYSIFIQAESTGAHQKTFASYDPFYVGYLISAVVFTDNDNGRFHSSAVTFALCYFYVQGTVIEKSGSMALEPYYRHRLQIIM